MHAKNKQTKITIMTAIIIFFIVIFLFQIL